MTVLFRFFETQSFLNLKWSNEIYNTSIFINLKKSLRNEKSNYGEDIKEKSLKSTKSN